MRKNVLDIHHTELDENHLTGKVNDFNESEWIILTWSTEYHNVIDGYLEFLEGLKNKEKDAVTILCLIDANLDIMNDIVRIKSIWIKKTESDSYLFDVIAVANTQTSTSTTNDSIGRFFENRVLKSSIIINEFTQTSIFRAFTDSARFFCKIIACACCCV